MSMAITCRENQTLTRMRMKMWFVVMVVMAMGANGGDSNDVYSPCTDAVIQKGDGFTLGLAFSSKDSFFSGGTQLSPCDKRLGLPGKNAKLSLFRPKVDEITLLTVVDSTFNPLKAGGYMVAFAGRKYAARSAPVMVADKSHTITSFTLVLEFRKGTLENLYWKQFGCGECSGQKNFVCVDGQFCGVPTSNCRGSGGGIVDCNLSIQLTFSGTDKNLEVLNSWYEVENLRQFSLSDLYSGMGGSIGKS